MFLLPGRYLYWPAQEAVLLADLHLGKATHFRREGVYVPGDIIQKELGRLQTMLESLAVRQVFILGDLFHARHNEEWEEFATFLSAWPHVAWHLVAGNHDVLPPARYQTAGLQLHNGVVRIAGLCLGHKPEEVEAALQEGEYGLAGHIHPGYVLRVRGVTGGVKLPCLWASPQLAVLPAWGQFTGLDIISPGKQDRLWLISPERVWGLG